MRIILAIIIISLFCLPNYAYAIKNEDCFTCHGEDIKPDAFSSSIHGKNLCTSCHTTITSLPHPGGLKLPTCNQCHRIEAEI